MTVQRFKLLCWKNFTLQKRHPIAGLIEIVFPILLVALLTFARSSYPKSEPTPEYRYDKFELKDYATCMNNVTDAVGVSPASNPALVGLIGSVIGNNLQLFDDSSALNQWLSTARQKVVGIEFNDDARNFLNLPKHLEYSIRMPQESFERPWLTESIFPMDFSKKAREPSYLGFPLSPPYVSSCFLTLQSSIDRAFIKQVTSSDAPALSLQRFPYPSVTEDTFIKTIASFFPVLFVFCMSLSAMHIIKSITIERESKLKETMKMMGLSSTLNWLAWFTKCFIMMEISVVGMTILMCTSAAGDLPFFRRSNFFLIWMFFNIYAISVITFCFVITVMFKKASTASTVGSLVFFVTLIPFLKFDDLFYSAPFILKALFCLLLNSGMGQGVTMILLLEESGNGLRFSNLFTRELGVGFSVGEVMLVMILTIAVHVLLTLYIEKVFPGDIGVPEPWYYPFMSCIKHLKKRDDSELENEALENERRISASAFEKEPNDLTAGIRIDNLTKKFGNKTVVNHLNLNIYEGQITVLLGHNGAGKTTTIQILTGMFPPTSGTAYVNGKDIRTEIAEARKSLGICPQHNILFDELTVREHIEFFSQLKGVKGKQEVADEVRRYVDILELQDKVNVQSQKLSGGMKRKLSIGIALCGHSKIVLLDEPTSGMDPAGRRALWDLLIAEKKSRTILLTTHHMDEADVLGDRIAIMADGQLRTVGSSFFLKKKFGAGYRLICVKEPTCDVNLILKTLKEYAPDTTVQSDTQTEAIFVIGEEHLSKFDKIFKRIEDNEKTLKISSFGCGLSTLEEVFLKIGADTKASESDNEVARSDTDLPEHSTSILLPEKYPSKVFGAELMLYQIEAMMLKKYHYLRRNYRFIVYLTLVTIWFIITFMSVPSDAFDSIAPLHISLSSYDATTTVIQQDNGPDELIKAYRSLLQGKDKVETVNTDMDTFILEKANQSLIVMNRNYFIGTTIGQAENIAWFNGQPFHTMPLTLNTFNRAVLRQRVGNRFDISVTNKPYIFISENDDGLTQGGVVLFIALVLFYILLIYWPSIFISFYIQERVSRAKLLQLISGANRFIYWLTAFLFDYTIYFVVICAIISGVAVFQRPSLSTFGELGQLLVIFMFYGFSMLPFIYTLSSLFANHSRGQNMVPLAGFLFAIIYGVYIFLKYLSGSETGKFFSKLIYWPGLLMAPFCLLDALVVLAMNSSNPGTKLFTLKATGVGRNIIMMFVGGCFFMMICLLKDHMWFEWFSYRFLQFSRKLPPVHQATDADVEAEIDRITQMSADEISTSNLVLKRLTKFYGKTLAVNQIHLSVDPSECFGLLGVNGAGKTTTFKMMTGDELISFGDAFIRGFSMRNQMHRVHQLIGYCPQFDGLLEDLTGRETLKIFSLLRGIQRNEIKDVTNKLATELGFEKHLDKKICALSGGNKRKLSTALALLGDPSLILLDEPTTGMDPGAKRMLWNIINRTRNSGRSVVLTSHSMEECEALCTKLAIMVNGELKCLGSIQHLKSKFSKGFVLTVKAGRDDATDEVQSYISKLFPSSEMKEKYLDIMTFLIPSGNLKWSQVFAMMAQMKKKLGLADYALTQTSLEQVFLSFAKRSFCQSETKFI